MNYINYLLLGLIMLIVELIYLRLASKFNIIDNPNNRSSHTTPTIRGGGIIIFLAFIIYGLWFSKLEPPYGNLILAVSLVAIVSFIDDLVNLSSKVRILVHLLAFSLVFYTLNVFNIYSILSVGLIYTIALCFLNIYNFMDGINGISFLNTLATYAILIVINSYYLTFTDNNLLIILTIATLVFGIFNFRNSPKCFAGDIGSITIGLSVIYFVLNFYLETNNPIIFLTLSMYIIDGGLTILERLFRKENIFKPHKKHLYQLLANDLKINHLVISSSYFLIQIIINIIAFILIRQQHESIFLVILPIGLLSISYILFKRWVIKKKSWT